MYLLDLIPRCLLSKYFIVLNLNCITNNVCYSTYKVKITIESTEENVTTEAYNKLLHIVPKGSVVEPV